MYNTSWIITKSVNLWVNDCKCVVFITKSVNLWVNDCKCVVFITKSVNLWVMHHGL